MAAQGPPNQAGLTSVASSGTTRGRRKLPPLEVVVGTPCAASKEEENQEPQVNPTKEDVVVSEAEVEDTGALLLPPPAGPPPSPIPDAMLVQAPAARPYNFEYARPDGADVGGEAPTGTGVVAGLVDRAERAERRATKAEADVRKLRADLHAMNNARSEAEERARRIEQAVHESGGSANEAWAARASVEERAARAESENVRLHCELQALRAALIGDDRPTGPAPQTSSLEPKYEAGLCLNYSCGCLCFFLAWFCSLILSVLCWPCALCGKLLARAAGVGGPSETPVEAVKAESP